MAATEVDVMDSKPEEDDLMIDDTKMDDGNAEMAVLTTPKVVLEKKPTMNTIAALQCEIRKFRVRN
jgi:hypothetical protein